jgi:exopolyphosphatase/guanosine-5'-triphosphate,3'-diphosphate pyrophosphatase
MPRYAAIDIGSNSVKFQVAEVRAGQPTTILAEDREVTRLGSGVFTGGVISPETIRFVCQVLRRMAQAYHSFDVIAVRAVATSAVRDASNQAQFIAKASRAIGCPVEIISGSEEARLIHLGVQSRWPHPDQRIMIVDVGGGSGEIIIGEHGNFVDGISRPLGAVRLNEMFMKSNPPAPTELLQLDRFIEKKLEIVVKRIGTRSVDRVIATSSTAAAVVCAVNQIPRLRREEADHRRATTAQVRKFFRELCVRTVAQRKKMVGIGPRRAEIIIPGTAVFLKILEQFQLPAIYYSAAGVRDGIIADLASRGVGRKRSRLTPEQVKVVEGMAKRFSVPLAHGRRVAALAHELFEACQPLHKLPPNAGKLLEAAAYLIDSGHYVSDVGHHKHSAYLVQNADLPNFDDRERLLIAMLCRYHRKSMPTARHEQFQALPPDAKRTILYLAPLLRIADALSTGADQKVEHIECHVSPARVEVKVASSQDLGLELWAAGRAGEVFRQVYGRPIVFGRIRRAA